MLGRQHYNAISRIIQSVTLVPELVIDHQELVERLAGYFAGDNPRFNKEKFVAACQKELTDGSVEC